MTFVASQRLTTHETLETRLSRQCCGRPWHIDLRKRKSGWRSPRPRTFRWIGARAQGPKRASWVAVLAQALIALSIGFNFAPGGVSRSRVTAPKRLREGTPRVARP